MHKFKQIEKQIWPTANTKPSSAASPTPQKWKEVTARCWQHSRYNQYVRHLTYSRNKFIYYKIGNATEEIYVPDWWRYSGLLVLLPCCSRFGWQYGNSILNIVILLSSYMWFGDLGCHFCVLRLDHVDGLIIIDCFLLSFTEFSTEKGLLWISLKLVDRFGMVTDNTNFSIWCKIYWHNNLYLVQNKS